MPAPFRQGGRGDGGRGLPRALCALAMTGFTWGAVQTGRRGRRPLRKRNKKCRWAGRCGHRPLRRGLQGVQQNGSSGKSAKRCQWQKKRGGFEEVPRLADTTVAGNRLARRWAREPRPYGSATRGAMGGRPQGSPLRKRYKGCSEAGRCGERTARCRWQRKRSERVAAVKISSVRRKAAQKFWAPQQDHRPLRNSL